MEKKQPAKKKATQRGYTLGVPLDVSHIEDGAAGERLKVVVRDADGTLASQIVKLSSQGKGQAKFDFRKRPAGQTVYVGPADAEDEELTGLQTLRVDVTDRLWADKRRLELAPLLIPPYYWFWWRRWCRTFTIRGRVECPDGSPVPAAEVCAYDVDRWFIWSSTQLVGCAVTDIDGAFELSFRWCCGWWPWWWWRYRIWRRDQILAGRLKELLSLHPEVRLTPTASHLPTLAIFNRLLAAEGLDSKRLLDPDDLRGLEGIRKRLLRKLPDFPYGREMRIWPWYPWFPWWDCTPDIIFKVTQDCLEPGTVILEEGVEDTRWNIPNPLEETLIVDGDLACCREGQDEVCEGGTCLLISGVCRWDITQIGGNDGALATPAGYLKPQDVASGDVAYNGDRPFGGVVNVSRSACDWRDPNGNVTVDYYEIEYHDGSSWKSLPAGGALGFGRKWLLWTGTEWLYGTQAFPYDATKFAGHTVYESREHFEVNGPYSDWLTNRFWISNVNRLMRLDSRKFPDGPLHDGTYLFRVFGYKDVGGTLVNVNGSDPLIVCGSEELNELVLTFDNRVIDGSLDVPSNPCSDTITNCTVHTCTEEPTTDFLSVTIGGVLVGPCDVVDAATGMLEIEFEVSDPHRGHLAYYELFSKYKENLYVDLLSLLSEPGASLVCTSGGQAGPTYGEALAQGAAAPSWNGGTMLLTVPADKAFPEPCCYQLELRARKRTVVSCDGDYDHCNLSEYTLGVGVCGPTGENGVVVLAREASD